MKKTKIVVYKAYIKDIDAFAIYDCFKDKMTDERLARISKTKNEASIKSIICTGALMALTLDKYLVYKDMIVSSSCGKPYIFGRDDLFFNVSNSGDYVAIAISEKEVGIDVQKPVRANEALVKRVISEPDREELREMLDTSFNAIWSIKEAYVKLTGEGISRDLSQISHKKSDDFISIYDKGILKAKGSLVKLEDDYYMAIASYDDFEMKIIDVDLSKR